MRKSIKIRYGSLAGLVLLLLAFLSPSFAAGQGDTGVKVAPDANARVDFKDILTYELQHRPEDAARPPRVVPRFGPTKPAPAPPESSPPGPPALDPHSLAKPMAPALAASFVALPDNGTSIPPDTMGAVGPNHLMTTLNTQVRIQTKDGAVVSTVSLLNWFKTGIPDTTDVFDPKIIFDPNSSRWIFLACSDRANNNTGILLAVSATSDPTGTWTMWRFKGDTSGVNWIDYPNIGVNQNWITFTANLFTRNGNSWSGVAIWAVDKNSALAGASSPTATLFTKNDSETGFTIVPALTFDATQATQHLVCTFNAGVLRLYSITGAGTSPTWNVGQTLAVTPWASNFLEAPQLGASQTVDAGDERMINAVYRNGSLWCTHTVSLPNHSPTHTAARWYQIAPATNAVSQQGTVDDFATSGMFYYYPSITVNATNQVLLGFSGSSTSTYIGAYYTYRDANTAANTMESVTQMKAGEASYYKTFSGSINRWGDYSATCVDPTDDLTMWTIQEYAASASANVWSTWWGKLAASQSPNTAIFWRNGRNGRNIAELLNNLVHVSYTDFPAVPDTNWSLAAVANYNPNNVARLFWRNCSTGRNSMESMKGLSHQSYAWLQDVANTNWSIVGAGNFNGDGTTALLWRNLNGNNAVENLDANFQHVSYNLIKSASPDWRAVGVGDFNADGKPDIVWRNTANGLNAVWFMNNLTYVSFAMMPVVTDQNWSIMGVADFNEDSKPDLVWRNTASGQNLVEIMDGVNHVSYNFINPVNNLDWRIGGAANLRP